MVDLLTPFTLGHAATVAELAGQASARLGMPPTDAPSCAGRPLLHDLGPVAVPGGVWERPSPLSATQWEQVRLHPYHSERILVRSAALAVARRLAGGPVGSGGGGPAAGRRRPVEPPDRRHPGHLPPHGEHHVQHVYTKIGVSTRAAAAMFAMRHGLVR